MRPSEGEDSSATPSLRSPPRGKDAVRISRASSPASGTSKWRSISIFGTKVDVKVPRPSQVLDGALLGLLPLRAACYDRWARSR